MSSKPLVILCLLILWDLVGFVIFLRGFLVLKLAVPGHGSWEKQPPEPLNQEEERDVRRLPPYDRLVVVLIDALRSDFLLPNENSDLPKMEHVSSLAVQGKAMSFLAQSHPPTVTLPRVKALTSGGIPGFVDVIMNFDSKALTDDNLVHQMKSAGRKVVFYGDDTWMQLFPGHFMRSEGTTSFFVTDYTEVDNNVTRHLDRELAAADWDALILHYLGLDHIGHTAGPRSPLVPGKLQEMDDIVRKISETVQEQDRQLGRSTLVVVCGDHGMSEQGGHGGSSYHETNTPLVLLSRHFTDNGVSFDGASIEQVDLVPTLSLLLGLPIPQNNLGVVITSVVEQSWTDMRDKLQVMHINAVQLSAVFAFSFRDYEKDPCYLELSRAKESHKNWLQHHQKNKALDAEQLGRKILQRYKSALDRMRDKLAANRTSYDMHAMRFGVATLSLVLLILVYSCGNNTDLAFAPTGWLTLGSLLGLLTSTHFLECLGPEASPLLCSADFLPLATVVLSIIAASFWVTVLVGRIFYLWSPGISKLGLPGTSVGKWLVVSTVGHSFTLLASSFVEEEHQTCYFISSTSLCLVLLDHMVSWGRAKGSRSSMSELHRNLYFKERNIPGSGEPSSNSDGNKSPKAKGSPPEVALLYLVSALCVTRILRAWNRTGDKWAHLPDVGDWLVLPHNKHTLSLLCAGALLLLNVAVMKKRQPSFYKFLFIITTWLVFLFRAVSGSLKVPFLTSELTKGIPESRAVYILMFILLSFTIWRSCRRREQREDGHQGPSSSLNSATHCDQLKCTWTLLMLLLLRPHNIPLVAMVFLLEELLGRLVAIGTVSQVDSVLLYYWFGQASFFWQGNSNSLSTVDVSAGYVGLSDFQPVLIGLRMCLATYAGPLFWLLALLQRWTSNVSRRQLLSPCRTLWLTRALPLAVYSVQVVFQRYHLFVWTVFSPKLLYEGMHSLVMAVALLLGVGVHSALS